LEVFYVSKLLDFFGKSGIIDYMMKRIFVCSEFGGLEVNVGLAMYYCLYVVRAGYNPFAPHVFYPWFLNEQGEREVGIKCGLDWMSCSDEVWAFVRHGKLSGGMRQEILAAIKAGMVIRYFDASLFDLAKANHEKAQLVPVAFDAIVALPHIAGDRLPTEAELLSAQEFTAKAQKGLNNVAKALSQGVRYEDLLETVDALLGESEQPRDEALEEKWEQDYRANR
jgi:hypothetical protein